ncbi:MAG: MlaD family protein [Xenococcaceae cyanobacterium MO_167.B52]|nr:MlaD family protein [Xenococcaceae cyanobacterium MO_167.B52]
MTNSNGNNRMSPSMRQSIVGLMLLVSLGFLGIIILWLRNFSFGGRSYQATIVFPNAGGMTPGTKVSYRGVKIGQVTTIKPEPEGVAIGVEIAANRLIPFNSRIETTQAGLVGETSIDITPLQSLPPNQNIASPLDSKCEPSLIICNGSILQGEAILNVNTLIRSLLRISNIIGDPETTAAIRSLVKNATNALGDVEQFFNNAQESGGLENLNSTLIAVEQAASQIDSLLAEVRQKNSVDNLNATLASIGLAAEEIKIFLATNRSNVANTLNSITQTSDQIRVAARSLTPIIQKVEQGKLIDNLDTIAENGVKLTANLADFSANLNDPKTVMLLEETLNSARSAFDNIRKITSDVDQLTGNPQFRQDVQKLIEGLSSLISSTQLLQQQAEYDRQFNRIAAEIAKIKSAANPDLDHPKSVTTLQQDINKFQSKP